MDEYFVTPMIDDLIIKKINTQLIIAEKLSYSNRPETRDCAYLIIDHIMERIGMCFYYEKNISTKPKLGSKDKDAILNKIKRKLANRITLLILILLIATVAKGADFVSGSVRVCEKNKIKI